MATLSAKADNGIAEWEIMDTALTVLERPELPAELIAPLKLAADFAQASKAPATQAAYGSDFRIFETVVHSARAFGATGHRGGVVRVPGRRSDDREARQHARAPLGRHPVLPPRRRP
jgi:hypothetical protein